MQLRDKLRQPTDSWRVKHDTFVELDLNPLPTEHGLHSYAVMDQA